MSAPRVSIVVPCYNLGQYLAEAVDSVLGQSFTDFEILVVDDGSTDAETRTILDGFSRPKTRLLRSENRGLPGAKNLGIANTSGDLLCMLDADDVLEPEMLARSVEALDAAPSMAFASHWLRAFGDEHWEWTPASCELPALLDINAVNGSAVVRRSAIDAIGGFDDAFRDGCEDWDLWISMVERGFPGMIIPEFLFRYRRRSGSMSRVMMQGDIYRRLVRKHAASYVAHLDRLLVRREREEAHLRRQIHDLELGEYLMVRPDLTSARDDLRDAERRRRAVDDAASDAAARAREVAERAAALAVAEQRAAERDAALASAERLSNEHAAAQRAHADAEARCLAAEAVARRTIDEVAALRRSWSWRLTSPLRAALDLIRPPKAPR